MIEITETVTTARPRPEVFAYVADFTTTAEWDPGIRACTLRSGDGTVGSVYDVTATFMGREVSMAYEVVEYAQDERLVIRGEAPTVAAVDTIEISESTGATLVGYSARFTLRGPLRFLELLLRPVFGRLGRRAMAGLEAVLNGGTFPPSGEHRTDR